MCVGGKKGSVADDLSSLYLVTEVNLGVTETIPQTPPPTIETAAADQPVINITGTESPVTQTSSDSWPNRSSASQSSFSSATHSEVSSSDMSIQVRQRAAGVRIRFLGIRLLGFDHMIMTYLPASPQLAH